MANSIYSTFNQQPNMMERFNQFMQNPMQTLMQKKLNIPQQYQNNPKEMVQHLLNSGQMTQEQLNKLVQQAQSMGIKL